MHKMVKIKKDNQILVGPQEFNYRKRRKEKKKKHKWGRRTNWNDLWKFSNRIQIHILILS